MTPSQLRAKVIAERVAWIRQMLAGLRTLPLDTFDSFQSDPRNIAAGGAVPRGGLRAQPTVVRRKGGGCA